MVQHIMDNILKNIKNNIGGFQVIVMDELRDKYPDKFNESGSMNYQWFEKEIRPRYFIYVRQDVNSISFTLQNGHMKEVGINGCGIDTLIHAAIMLLEESNKQLPRSHFTKAIETLHQTIYWLNEEKNNEMS